MNINQMSKYLMQSRSPSHELSTSQRDIEYMFDMVRGCNYVFNNPEYTKKAKETKIYFESKNDDINAYATSKRNGVGFEIHIYNGLCNSSKAMGLALAQYKQTTELEPLINACRFIGHTAQSNNFQFTSEHLQEFIDYFNIDMNSAIAIDGKGYYTGGVLSVIAHELGHICLAHVSGRDDSLDVSRNDERQADLFAYSVVSTTPFESYNVLATLFIEIVFCWLNPEPGEAITHPHSRERVMNTLNSNARILNSLDITKDNIDLFLP